MDATVRLQDEAGLALLLALAPAEESGTSGILENLPNTLASSSRALEVLLGANLLCYRHTLCTPQSELHACSGAAITHLLGSHRSLVRLPQLIGHPWVASEILLAGDQDYRKARAEMHDLRNPLYNYVSRQKSWSRASYAYLLLNVVQRVRGVNGEADQDDMGIGITEWAETVIVLLSGRIPQGKLNVLPIDFDIGHIVLEHSGNINLASSTSDEDIKLLIPRGLHRKCVVCTLQESACLN